MVTAMHPTWEIVHARERDVFALGGDWIAQAGGIPQFSPDGFAESAAGRTPAFDTTRLGRWDTGLIEFLWDAKRMAASAGLIVDGSGLPDSARKLLGLLPENLARPGSPLRRRFRPLYELGGKTLG